MKLKKVFCIGLSRTGTTSICEALKILGYETLHFSPSLFTHPEIISDELSFIPKRKLNKYWSWRRDKELKVLNNSFNNKILRDFDAFGDLPIPIYYKYLDKKFPGSRFIYTFRNEDKWLKSMNWLYFEGAIIWSHGLIDDEMKLHAYNCFKYDENSLLESFKKHHNEVNSYFKDRPTDLLKLNIDSEDINFKQVCEFLERPLPMEPFPKSNITRTVEPKKRMNYYLTRKIPFYDLLKQKIL